jgi:hypothetical protein
MSTGSAKSLLVFAILAALGGCASGKPQPILGAAELESMIRVEIQPLETDIPEAGITDERSVAAVQP